MFGLTRGSLQPGWIGCAPHGDSVAVALVQPGAQGKPVILWTADEPWSNPSRTLQQLKRRRALARHPRVALLQHAQYQCVAMDAPADVPRADWAAAVRWQLKDTVDFAVDSAALDVLAVPEGTSYRAQAQLIVVAAAAAEVAPLVAQASDAGVAWQAIDIAETALRNLGALVEPEGRAQAVLHCQARHATLIVTCGGALMSTRRMDLALAFADDDNDNDNDSDNHNPDPASRNQAYEQAGLELQRTLDGIERAFGQVTLARLLITPMPGVQRLCDHLGPLLYVPVAPLQLDEVLDFSAVPELLADAALLNHRLLAIGAALRPADPPATDGPTPTARQINLFDARLAPQQQRFSARQGLLAMAGVAVLSLASAQGLRLAAKLASDNSQATEAQIAPLKAQRQALAAAATPSTGADLAALRTVEAGQRRIASALQAGVAGAREGHADYLAALARRASAQLWITGFSVSDDGSAIELAGRMADASVLADYLRSLNAEPRFKGRPFAQLSLKSVDNNGSALPYVEFALLSRSHQPTAASP